ncbi:hypothetical protein [Luteibacter sp. Lutesp34]|uniref:hypothetical protein n=1 Tax=Luteibacter sp. Lutesp34 TaxID=3243030 RepID=UPI0039B6705C
MTIPLSLGMSVVLALVSMTATAIFMLAVGMDWVQGCLMLVVTLLFSVFVPCSALATFGKMLDDRSMSLEQVSAQSNGSLPSPLLRWIYNACVAFLYISLSALFATSVTYWSGQSTNFPTHGDRKETADALLLAASVAGVLASCGMTGLQRHKLRRLWQLSAFGGAGFLLVGIFAIAR